MTSPAGNRILCCKYGGVQHEVLMIESFCSHGVHAELLSVCRNQNVWIGKMHKPGDDLNNFLSCCTHWPVGEDVCWEIVLAGAVDWQLPVRSVVRGQV